MPYEVGWYIEGRVIHDQLSGTITIEDAETTSLIIADYLEQGTRPVHLLVDMTEATGLSPSANLRRINDVMRHMRHDSLGWTLLITTNKLARFLASTVTQLSRVSLQTFVTLDEALAFLREYDHTLAGQFPGEAVSGTAAPPETVPGEAAPIHIVLDEAAPAELVPDEAVPDETNPLASLVAAGVTSPLADLVASDPQADDDTAEVEPLSPDSEAPNSPV